VANHTPHGFGHGGSSDLLCYYAFDLLDPTKNLDPLNPLLLY
jgi:hypothetical protein